jgi:hypothetical protein
MFFRAKNNDRDCFNAEIFYPLENFMQTERKRSAAHNVRRGFKWGSRVK